MRRFYGRTMLAAGLVIGLAAMVGAQPPAGGAGMRGQGMGPGGGPMAALKLTSEQHEQIQAIMQKQRDANQTAMVQVRELRKQLHAAIYADGNEGAAVKLATEIATIEATHRVQMQLALKTVLTPEQLKIVLDSGMDFPPAGMGPGAMRGRRGGQPPPVKK
jgi:Spy/CpxP family protein refolding chaperone